MNIITIKALSKLPHINHGFFTRQDGVSGGIYKSLNCGTGSKDDLKKIKQNRNLVANALEARHLISGHQTHSTNIIFIDDIKKFNGDGAITKLHDVALGILTADCAPILFADKTKPIIAAAHAGWRGAVGGITDNVIKEMVNKGSLTKDIIAAIGPHISFAAYEVGEDMRDKANALDPNAREFFVKTPTKFRFNLGGYLKAKLEHFGVEVVLTGGCTLSQPESFFSYRQSLVRKTGDYGRQISAIVLRP